MSNPTLIGYARVSSASQSRDNQVARLTEAGCSEVFQETESGSRNVRGQVFRSLMARAAELRSEGLEVTIVTTKVDRFSRSTLDFLTAIQELAELGVSYRALDNGFSYVHGDAHSKFYVVVFSAVAELERSLIRARTDEGRAAYLAKGNRLGAKPKLTEAQVARIRADYATGNYSPAELGKLFGVGKSTILRVLNIYGYTEPYLTLEAWKRSTLA